MTTPIPRNASSRINGKIQQIGGIHPKEQMGAGGATFPEGPAFLPSGQEKLLPNDLALRIMAQHRFLQTQAKLLYEYNGRFWERKATEVLHSYALAFDMHQLTSEKRRSEAASYILRATMLPDIPWRCLAPTEVPVHNGVVDVVSCQTRPHRPEDYLEAVVPHDYDPNSRCPLFLAALNRWFRGDADAESKILAVQEFFGYLLLPHAHFKKAMFLHGESDTGKSQLLLVARQMVGDKNCCALSTDQMANEQRREPIVGKMLNALSELPANAIIKDGGFKQLVSTGDPIQIDPKNKRQFSYVPFCKHVICANNLPEINDLSRATFNRLLLIKFNNILPPSEQDKTFQLKIAAELQGIVAWSVEGAARLCQQNGEFTAIEESLAEVKEYRRDQNPVNEFIESRCNKSPDGWIVMEDFREQFWKWSKERYGVKTISTMLRSAGYKIRPEAGVRYAIGISWKPANPTIF